MNLLGNLKKYLTQKLNEQMEYIEDGRIINCQYNISIDNFIKQETSNECSIKTIEFLAKQKKTVLLGNQFNLAEHYCYTNDSIIIWNDEIFQLYDMELITKVDLTNIAETHFYSNSNLYFKVVSTPKKCGQTVHETSSYLYFVFNNKQKVF